MAMSSALSGAPEGHSSGSSSGKGSMSSNSSKVIVASAENFRYKRNSTSLRIKRFSCLIYVDESNLQRQTLFDEDDWRAGLPKAIAAEKKLSRINSDVEVEAHVSDVHAGNVRALFRDVDLVIDGTDNFETRYLLNDAAIDTDTPWIYAACAEETVSLRVQFQHALNGSGDLGAVLVSGLGTARMRTAARLLAAASFGVTIGSSPSPPPPSAAGSR